PRGHDDASGGGSCNGGATFPVSAVSPPSRFRLRCDASGFPVALIQIREHGYHTPHPARSFGSAHTGNAAREKGPPANVVGSVERVLHRRRAASDLWLVGLRRS